MSELIGYTRCSQRNCNQAAEFKKDKRKKKFINCPVHGRIPGSTNQAQDELEALLTNGLVFDTVADFQEFSEKPEEKQAVSVPEKPEIKPEIPQENIEALAAAVKENSETGKGKGGIIVLGIGLILGVGTWILKVKTNQSASQAEQKPPGLM